MKKKLSYGFSLVEIAIVLVIVGFLIGGVLRGQELINSAKVRNMIDQSSSIQTGILGFSNRYKATAGDLTAAQRDFIGGGVLASTGAPGDGIITIANAGVTNESALVFQNLAATGFLNCTPCMTLTAATSNVPSTRDNSPSNLSGGVLLYGTVAPSAVGVSWLDGAVPLPPSRNVLITGAQIPSSILQEMDIKADDGAPATGLFRQSTTGGAGTTANCAPANATGVLAWSTTASNCAGAWLY